MLGTGPNIDFVVLHVSSVVRCRVIRIVKKAVTMRISTRFLSKKQLLIYRTEY